MGRKVPKGQFLFILYDDISLGHYQEHCVSSVDVQKVVWWLIALRHQLEWALDFVFVIARLKGTCWRASCEKPLFSMLTRANMSEASYVIHFFPCR